MPTPSRNCIAFWQKLRTRWEKKFGEEIDADLLHLISVERIFHREDFKEVGRNYSCYFFCFFYFPKLEECDKGYTLKL